MSNPWIKGPPKGDGYYVIRIQQIGGDEWFYTASKIVDGYSESMISEDNMTHHMLIPEAPE